MTNTLNLIWKTHPKATKWDICTQYSFDILVRNKPLPDGYMWQVHNTYGYELTQEAAKEQAAKYAKKHVEDLW
jgi:hypothetical protein